MENDYLIHYGKKGMKWRKGTNSNTIENELGNPKTNKNISIDSISENKNIYRQEKQDRSRGQKKQSLRGKRITELMLKLFVD